MTQYGQPDRFCAGATRELSESVGAVRTVVLQVLRALEFQATREHYSVIEAERGSKLRGMTMTRTRVPTHVHIDVVPSGGGTGTGTGTSTTVTIRIEERWPVASTRRGTVSVYADVFTEVLTALDAALSRLDPPAAAAFPQWWRLLPEHEIAATRGRAETATRTERALQRGTARLLDGPRTGPSTPLAEARLDTVTFLAPGSATRLPAATVDAMLTVGQLVASAPGSMPAALVSDVEATVLVLEQHMTQVGTHGAPGGMTIHVDGDTVPVISFLFQQASLREALPVRVLMRCTTCRLEKVVNPDLAKLRERNRRVRILQTSVGAVLGTHQISPFILVGRLAQLKKTEPDFVCLRCQGTDADQRPITFCSRCGERLDGSVLRACPKCKLDLRSLVGTASVWTALEAAPAPTPLPPDDPPPDDPPPVDPPPVDPPAGAPPPETRAETPALPVPGYYADPAGRADHRYWDGLRWTEHVLRGGLVSADEI